MGSTWTRVTTSQKVSKVGCKVGSVVLTPDSSSNNADVTLYDGESTSDPILFTVRSGSGVTNQLNFTPPLECQRGLYVVIGSNVTEVVIQWEPM